MRTLLKIIAALIALVVVVVIAAVIIVPMVFDPNDYKEEIATAAKEETGRDLRIQGDIGLSVFPWLGVNLGVVELGNAPGFAGDYFARTREVDVRLKLLPLLERKIEMSTVTVRGLELNLVRAKDGRTNWDDLAAREGGKRPERPRAAEPGPGIAALAIGGLDIEGAALHWTDERAGQRFAIRDLTLKTGAVALGRPVELELGFSLESGKPPIAGRVSLRATLDVDPARQAYRADDLQLEAALSGDSLPGGKANLVLKANASADLAGQTARIDDLELRVLGLAATGNLSAKQILGPAKVVNGALRIARFDPRALMKALGQAEIETADPAALTALSASITITGKPGRVALAPLVVELDDTRLEGTAEVARFDAPLPAVRFALTVDAIDADRYLPPKRETPPATPAAAASATARLPLGTLRALDVDGKLRVGKLGIANLKVTDIEIAVRARKGLITVKPMAAKLYGGTYTGATVVDVRGDTPKLAVEERLAGVQVGPLLDALQGKGRLSGTANAQMKVTAAGAGAAAVKRTLNGTAKFAFTDGAVKGINIARMIREAQAKLKGQSLPPSKEALKTDFSELTGSVRFRNGLASNDDLLAKSPLLRVEGKGTANLVTEKIDYRVKTTLVATTKGQGGAGLQDLAGIPIPIKVTGGFAQPRYRLDFEAFASAVAKSKAAALIGKQKAAVKSKALGSIKKKLGGNKAGGLLKGLLK